MLELQKITDDSDFDSYIDCSEFSKFFTVLTYVM